MRCLNAYLESFYARYAYVVYQHTWLFIILPLALTACLSVGFVLMDDRMVNETTYLFTPHNGQHRYEKAVLMEHWPFSELEENFVAGYSVDVRHWTYVIVMAKNKTLGLWNNETLDQVLALNEFIINGYSVKTDQDEFTYSDICLKHNRVCFGNGHVMALRGQSIIVDYGGPRVQYPLNHEYLTDDASYLGYLMGNVTVNKSDHNVVLDVGALRLVYFTRRQQEDEGKDYNVMSLRWRLGVQQFLLDEFKTDPRFELLEIAFSNEDTINQGLILNAAEYAPDIAVTFALMLVFSFLNSFLIMQRQGFCGLDWVRSKPMLAVFGMTEPGLAIVSTIGFMLLIGVPYYPILVVMPFLVFAIGVDDMFIVMSAWHGTKKTDPPEVRFSHTFKEAAVSITITSVSDVLAFAIGAWNSLPGVQLFCAYTSVAFFFELIYQCTFYAAAVAIFAKAECNGQHCVTLKKALPLEEAKTKWQRRFLVGTLYQTASTNSTVTQQSDTPASSSRDDPEMNFVQKIFHNYYVPTIMHPITKFLALLLFILYLGISGWGCAVMQSGLPAEKLMLKGHYSVDFLRMDGLLWQNGTPVQVVVSNPANFTTTDGRTKMLNLVSAFENTRHTMDSAGTFFWLREYLRFLNKSEVDVEDTRDQWCQNIRFWGSYEDTGYRFKSIRWANDTDPTSEDYCRIKAFRFIISVTDYYGSANQLDAVVLIRDICDRFKEYNVTSYNEYTYPYVDQFLMVNPTMIRNGIIAVVAMIVISMLMIPHPVCGIFIALSTVSIDTGVTGFLSWWDVNLDSFSMMTMIMATGFAVDLSAHISYAYVRSHGQPTERVRHALEELGWPVFQGVTSTLLGVLVLGLLDAYMYQTFFKTVFLVIVFGVLHSLFFLPIALTIFAPTNIGDCKRRSKTPITDAKTSNGNMAISDIERSDHKNNMNYS